ncbi:MAG: outer membrane beta-barrel protein [Rikenellaceae bacterium]|jgi:hypothetical protein|nr:outer membrane beta-barrel protein [Rikenellaceae bacterium]
MKRIFTLFCTAFVVGTAAIAQSADTIFQEREVVIIDEEPQIKRDTSSFEVKRTNPLSSNVIFFGLNHISLGYNGLIENLGEMDLPDEVEWMKLKAKSIQFKLMLAEVKLNLARHLDLRMGFELEVDNYRFQNKVTLMTNEFGKVAPDYSYADARLEKTKLVNCFLNVPLVARVGIGNRNQIVLYGGVVGGWRWNSYTKVKGQGERLNGKRRFRDNQDYNLRNFHYGYTAGIWFDQIGVYAAYYPHSIFRAGDVDVRQVNVGISFLYY